MIAGKQIGQGLDPHDLLRNSLRSAFVCGYPTALWRSPGEEKKQQVIDLSGDFIASDQNLEDLPQGFIFSSFHEHKKYYIKQDISLTLSHGEFEFKNLSRYSSEKFMEEFEDGESSPAIPYANPQGPSQETRKSEYLEMVNAGIEQVRSGRFLKVVPARTMHVALSEKSDAVSIFLDLCERYPNAFVSLVSIPEAGTWIGATPESLISLDEDGTFTTMALAGTQPQQEGFELHEYPWTQKEIEEQAHVTRYIIECFKKIRLREYVETGPETIAAGKLVHLCSTFNVDTGATNFPDLCSVMLKLLHPTSAVCGMPKESALEFIQTHEAFDREFFSGYLGPVNIDRRINVYVNLRCMQLFPDKAILYAGAGVTMYSQAEKEWQETTLKCNTIKDVL